MKKFRLVRDEYGFICAIAYGRQWILHIKEGTTLNKHFEDFWKVFVPFLNDWVGQSWTDELEKMIKEWK